MLPILELPVTIKDRLHILACPQCRGNLTLAEISLHCSGCGTEYPIRNGKIYFVTPPPHDAKGTDIKDRLKRILGNSYKLAVALVGPIFPFNAKRELLKHIDPEKCVVVDIGSGPERIHPSVVTMDLFDYDSVDIVCNVDTLPFADCSIDGFVSLSLMEHVENPSALVVALKNATVAGGIGLHHIPFLYHFHESPRDYFRFTHMGLDILFRNWTIVKKFGTAGPFSLFVTLIVEILSNLFSFGNERLKESIYLLLCVFTFPIKFLDVFLLRCPRFLSTAPAICIVVKKPPPCPPGSMSRSTV